MAAPFADKQKTATEKLVRQPRARQSVTLFFNLNGDGSGDEKGAERDITLPFFVEEMIVRQVTVNASAAIAAASMPLVRSTGLCKDLALCTLPAANGEIRTATPQTTCMINRELRGKVQFNFFDNPGTGEVLCVLDALVALTLEFIGRE